jgi:hypothetical protein
VSREPSPKLPERIKRQAGRYSLVDGIPFKLPVDSHRTPALVAGFPLDAKKADRFLPGDELHAARLWGNRGLLLVTVVNYSHTDIGSYVEFSIAIACTRGERPAPPLLPFLRQRRYGFGQYVYDLPVSTQISVRGGLGIWGMPKRQANLDFKVTEKTVSSQYDLEGQLVVKIEISRPRRAWLPLAASAVSYSAFRGMLWQSYVYFSGRVGLTLLRRKAGRLHLGDHPRAAPLKELDIDPRPLFTGFVPNGTGVLDDHVEAWFIAYEDPPDSPPEGLEQLEGVGLGRDWLPPPVAAVTQRKGDS